MHEGELMAKRLAILGDKTTTGGVIITGSGHAFCNSSSIALLGDKVSCPSCKEIGIIIQGAHHFTIHGKPVAYDGCLVACGCPNNRIVAMKSTMFLDELTNSDVNYSSLVRNNSSEIKDKKISQIYWSYGENKTELSGISRHYVDINLHVQTENYNQGESIDVILTYHDENNAKKTLTVSGVVGLNGLATIMDVFSEQGILLINDNE